MRRRAFLSALGGGIMSSVVANDASGQACFSAPQIPHAGLPDIAMVTVMNGQIVILYNPQVVAMAGPILTAFFEAHEYGHVCLNHVQMQMFFGNPFNRQWMSQNHELQADSFATQLLARRSNQQSIVAAAQWFSMQYPSPHQMLMGTHPPGPVRAQNIVATAKSMGVPI